MQSLSALVLAAVAASHFALVNAGVYVTNPVAATTCHGGQSCEVDWVDDGAQPLLSAIGECSVGLYNGELNQVQALQSVDVSSAQSFTFTPNPSAGTNGQYYIVFSSNAVSGYQSFSASFTLDGMTGSAGGSGGGGSSSGSSTATGTAAGGGGSGSSTATGTVSGSGSGSGTGTVTETGTATGTGTVVPPPSSTSAGSGGSGSSSATSTATAPLSSASSILSSASGSLSSASTSASASASPTGNGAASVGAPTMLLAGALGLTGFFL